MSSPNHLSLFRRANGVWYILSQSDDGKTQWKTTRCTKKSEALKVLTSFEKIHKRPKSHRTLTEFQEEFLKNGVSNYTKGTIDLFHYAFMAFQNAVGNIRIGSVNKHNIDTYKTLRITQVKPVTVNLELRTLRSAFTIAMNWGWIESNPFKNIPFVRVAECTKTFFGQDDFQKLFEAINELWLRDVVLFAILTGLRRGEIINLSWQQVDMNKRWVHIQSSENYQTKQGKQRTIPLGEAACLLLQKRRDLLNDGLVFRMDDGKAISGYWATHKLKQYIRKLGLDDKLHFHSLRHSCASWLAADGVSIYHIAKLLGHTTVSTTEKFYAHLQPESLRETVNRIAL